MKPSRPGLLFAGRFLITTFPATRLVKNVGQTNTCCLYSIYNLKRDSLWFRKFRNLIFIPHLKSKREISIYIQTLPLSPSFLWPDLVAYLYSLPIIQIPRKKTDMTVKWGASSSLRALGQQPRMMQLHTQDGSVVATDTANFSPNSSSLAPQHTARLIISLTHS